MVLDGRDTVDREISSLTFLDMEGIGFEVVSNVRVVHDGKATSIVAKRY